MVYGIQSNRHLVVPGRLHGTLHLKVGTILSLESFSALLDAGDTQFRPSRVTFRYVR